MNIIGIYLLVVTAEEDKFIGGDLLDDAVGKCTELTNIILCLLRMNL